MRVIKALIADDSVVYRSQIKKALDGLPGVEVVGVASNGRLAVERMLQNSVDLLILDLEMPEMDGLQTLQEIQRRGLKCRTLVFSSTSKRGAESTLEALRFGACDFIPKPGGNPGGDPASLSSPEVRIRELLAPKVQALFPENHSNELGIRLPEQAGRWTPSEVWSDFRPEVVVVGSSTGGPTVLEKIFADLSTPPRCPVLVVQHMPPIFTATLAERIQKLSGIPACEARNGMDLEAGRIYIAPGDFHMTLTHRSGRDQIVLDQGPQVNSVRPAVDPLFISAASRFGKKCLGIVLTGMGADGARGATAVKGAGGRVVIQDEASCVVFGMPGAVKAAGAFDRVMNPAEIVRMIREKTIWNSKETQEYV